MQIRQITSSDGGLIENEAIATDHVLTASVAHLSQNPGDNTSMRTCCHSSLHIAAAPHVMQTILEDETQSFGPTDLR